MAKNSHHVVPAPNGGWNVRKGGKDGEQQPQGIDQQMAFASFDLLAAILSMLRASHLGGLHCRG